MKLMANKPMNFAPDFRSGIASVVCPWKHSIAYRKALKQRIDNGIYIDGKAIAGDFKIAIANHKANTSWKNK